MQESPEHSSRSLVYKSLACIVVFSAAAFLAVDGEISSPITDIPIDARAAHWQSRIASVGAAAAYDEFARSVGDITSPQKHFNAHIFGTTLFDTMGIEGAAVCDGRFNYGCFHAFMIRAVEVRGAQAAQELHDACRSVLGPTAEQCEHGIGHGLLGTIGYGTQDLEQVLAICEDLTPPSHPVGGCIGGAFMEYGLRGMQGAGTRAMRPFTDTEALEPCLGITSKAHQTACAFWQPMWWMETHPQRADGAFMARRMGEWCRQLPGDESALPTCIAGIANRMELIADGDPRRTAEMCSEITPVPRLREYCQMKSAMQFSRYHDLAFSLTACDGLPSEGRERCREDATDQSAARRRDQDSGIETLPGTDVVP